MTKQIITDVRKSLSIDWGQIRWVSLLRRCSTLGTLVSLSWLMGCVSANDIKTYLIYEPVQVESPMTFSVGVEVTHNTSPEVMAAWKAWAWNLDSLNADGLVADAIYNDLAKSRMFSSVSRDNPHADFLIVVHSQEIKPSDFRLQLTLAVLNLKTKETVLSYQREQVYATGVTDYRLRETLRDMMGQIKAAMAADFKSKDLSKLGGKFSIAGTSPASVNGEPAKPVQLEDLLVAKENNIAFARQRNRALIACKTLTLPALLREKKTAELSALTVQIEQTVLDLNHEAELEKDRAQRALEQAPKEAEEHRELAIAYKERIEVLKPIGAAIKDEIANRAK